MGNRNRHGSGQIKVSFCDQVDDDLLRFAVIAARTDGRWVFCKHRDRDTWEMPGGHRETGEGILATAQRELYEETGAVDYSIQPVCAYSVTAPGSFAGQETFGMLYFADVKAFEPDLHSEIERVVIQDELPTAWTYPDIQPRLIHEVQYRICAKLIVPKYDDLWFRQEMMADPDTMGYNNAWGGTVPFPQKDWASWYDRWVADPEDRRFYRSVVDRISGTFVGEAAYHRDEGRSIWYADVLIAAKHRRRGYGRAALRLLCDAARERGVDILRDHIAIGNPAVEMFLSQGFTEEYRTDETIMLKKEL